MVDFRKKKEALKHEVHKLHDDVKSKNDNVMRVLCPSLDNVMTDLNMNISQQNLFNEKMQEDIIDAKTEFQELQYLMSECGDRIQYLEEDMGVSQ
jgi:hypothetical protein